MTNNKYAQVWENQRTISEQLRAIKGHKICPVCNTCNVNKGTERKYCRFCKVDKRIAKKCLAIEK